MAEEIVESPEQDQPQSDQVSPKEDTDTINDDKKDREDNSDNEVEPVNEPPRNFWEGLFKKSENTVVEKDEEKADM